MARGTKFPVGLTIACAIAFTLLCALGVWQVQRLQWKEGLIAQADRAATLPAAPFAEVEAEGLPEFRKVRLICPGLATAPYVELQSIDPDGQPGMRFISACRPAGGRTWLVDRGFVADVISARPAETADTTPVEILAEIRRAPSVGAISVPPEGRRFYARDTRAMAETLRVRGPVEPQTLFALTSSNPEWAALKPSAPPAAFSNNHLGYALTWFGLALALVGFYIAVLRRRRAATNAPKDIS